MRDLDNTPARLIAAAERLFADAGEEATSLRAITRAAMSNAAAVHYHFGGRDGLTRAVLDRHLGARHERRLRLLDRVSEQHGDHPPATAVVTAIVRPDLELIGKLRKNRVQVARFLGRAFAHQSPVVLDYLERQELVLADRALPMIAASRPELTGPERRARLGLVLDIVAMLYATAADPGAPGPLGTDDVDEQLRRLVAFVVGGLTASGSAKQPATPTGAPAAAAATAGAALPTTKKRRKA